MGDIEFRWGIGDTVYIKCDDDNLPRESNKCEVVNVQTLKTFECIRD